MTKSYFSTPKIVLYALIFCALMITALVMTRLHQTPHQSPLTDEEGAIFPAGRELKPFELITEQQQAFTQQNLLGHWTLLFFGFTHCTSICPTTMDLLNRVYAELHSEFPSLQIVLVSIDPDRDTPEVVTRYAHSFNSNFIGVTGKKSALRKLQSQLGIYSAMETASTEKDYQLQHTSSIMLITPKGQWAGLFHQGLNKNQFVAAFQKTVRGYPYS